MPRTTWKWFLAVSVVLAVVYGLLPAEIWKEPLYDVLVTAAFLAIWIGRSRFRPAAANQWSVLLAAMGCIGAAEWIFFADDVRGTNPFPSWAELFDVAGCVLLLVALIGLSAHKGQLRDRLAAADALVVGFAAAALASTFVFGEYFVRSDVGILERLTTTRSATSRTHCFRSRMHASQRPRSTPR